MKEQVIEDLVAPPSKRANFSFTAHPDKDEIILFGGEYFNGNKTFMYNDLFFYNIKKNQWIKVKAPNSPLPRSAHQAVALSNAGGQLWIFGGEYASPTQSQFHHYKELWVFHLQQKKWEKISCPGGPSARSGHRMTSFKKQIFIFGGYHDNNREYKYFNDMYKFDLELYQWTKIGVTGKIVPSPRSGCQMAALLDGRVLVYGGYSKEKQKRDVDKGVTNADIYILQPDKDKTDTWKWVLQKQTGCKPPPRCSFSLAVTSSDQAIIFGGVQDEDVDEEELEGTCSNAMYLLDMQKCSWYEAVLSGKKGPKEKISTPETGVDDGNTDQVDAEQTTSEDVTVLHEDDVFTVKIGPQTSSNTERDDCEASGTAAAKVSNAFVPQPRMSAGLAVHHGILYLYGGLYEHGDRLFTFSDMYSLDLKKMDEWRVLIPMDESDQEWFDSSSSSDDEESSEDPDESEVAPENM